MVTGWSVHPPPSALVHPSTAVSTRRAPLATTTTRPRPSLGVAPPQHRRLHAQTLAGHKHDPSAQLDVPGVLGKVAFVARHLPPPARLLDPDRHLPEKGLTGTREGFCPLRVEAPAIGATLGGLLDGGF